MVMGMLLCGEYQACSASNAILHLLHALKYAVDVQAVQDTAASGLPQLSRHAMLEPYVHVDNDTQRMHDEAVPSKLPSTIVGTDFLSAEQGTMDALASAFEIVNTFRLSLQPLLSMLQDMRDTQAQALEDQYVAGSLDLDGFRELLKRFEEYGHHVRDLEV
jgi:hypothetical protein